MKINELLNESAHDDWDKEEEEAPDPEQDKIPHIVMQLRKALNLKNYPITFKDGNKSIIPRHIIQLFLNRYSKMIPSDREVMQELASQSLEKFNEVLATFSAPPAPKSIYS
jgi:hypothetical protein